VADRTQIAQITLIFTDFLLLSELIRLICVISVLFRLGNSKRLSKAGIADIFPQTKMSTFGEQLSDDEIAVIMKG